MQLDELAELRYRVLGVPLDRMRSGQMAEDVGMRRAAVHQSERDARIGRMEQRPLALDPEQVALLGSIDHQPLGGAGEEV